MSEMLAQSNCMMMADSKLEKLCSQILGSIEVDETTTAASAVVTGEIADEAHFEDKVSYNQLFWPFTQAFKAPNVVR